VITRPITAALGITGVIFVTACGPGGAPPAPVAATSTAIPSVSTSGLTSAQGAAICGDIQAWIPAANNQDTPRFSAKLQQDETNAQGTALGTDMSTMDNDLQSENTAALLPAPPGQPSDISSLSADCQEYGVTLNWSAGD
jgi:hypothetical protein